MTFKLSLLSSGPRELNLHLVSALKGEDIRTPSDQPSSVTYFIAETEPAARPEWTHSHPPPTRCKPFASERALQTPEAENILRNPFATSPGSLSDQTPERLVC